MDIEKSIRNEYKRVKRSYITALVMLLLAAAVLLAGIVHYFIAYSSMKEFEDILTSSASDRTRKYAYMDIYGAFIFASEGNAEYYIAYNDQYYYIFSTSEDNRSYLQNCFETAGSNPVRLYGWTMEIPDEARSFATSALNVELEGIYVNQSNFESYFGDLRLRVIPESKLISFSSFFEYSTWYVLAAGLLVLMGLPLFAEARRKKKSYAPFLEESDPSLMSELRDENAVWNDQLKTCVTDNYLVSARNRFAAVRFSDIFLAYITKHKTNGIPDYDYISVCTRDGQKLDCANSGSFGKTRKEETAEMHAALLEQISTKNPTARIGFTPENVSAFTELQKQVKEKKKAGLM